MASPIIKLENVKRTYHVGDVDVHALRDVTLTVNAGEFVAIMGSSGSGKSTLMAIIGCLDRPSSGRYFFEGVDVAGLAEPDRARLRSERLGFVFQSFNLLARTSALENVALPLFYAASGPAGTSSRLERAAYVLSNSEPFASLSTEERARVIREQTLIVQFDLTAAISTLVDLLPDLDTRAIAVGTVDYIVGPVEEMEEHTVRAMQNLRCVLELPPLRIPAEQSEPSAAGQPAIQLVAKGA